MEVIIKLSDRPDKRYMAVFYDKDNKVKTTHFGYAITDNGSGGLRDNQLKPALSIWSLIKLIFKTYGYTLSGDFFNSPPLAASK